MMRRDGQMNDMDARTDSASGFGRRRGMPHRAVRRGVLALGALGALGVALLSGGCIHANLPGKVTNTQAITNPNAFPAPRLMAMSLEFVVNRHPPQAGSGEPGVPVFAFSLPEGVSRKNHEIIESMLQGRGVPATPESVARFPVYHLVTMWIRGSRAEVELVYPIEGVGVVGSGAESRAVYRGVSLKLGSDVGPWRVLRQQLWNVGTIPVPEVHYMPTSDEETSGMPALPSSRPRSPETDLADPGDTGVEDSGSAESGGAEAPDGGDSGVDQSGAP
jgi:hypothetical protein